MPRIVFTTVMDIDVRGHSVEQAFRERIALSSEGWGGFQNQFTPSLRSAQRY